MSKVFFDTEFTRLHKDTTLISIGLISEEGFGFYGEFTDYDRDQCDDFVCDNVLPYLLQNECNELEDFLSKKIEIETRIGDRFIIRKKLSSWLKIHFDQVDLFSDVCHYDMVLFTDIFNGAMNLPKCVVPVCYDINQDIAAYYGIGNGLAFDKNRESILADFGIDNPSKYFGIGTKHNSIYDALVIRTIHQLLNNGGVINGI